MVFDATVDELRSSGMRFKLLSDIAGELLLADDPRLILPSIFHRIAIHLDLEFHFNYLVEPGHDRLRLACCGGVSSKVARSLEWLRFGEAVCGTVARRAEPMIVEEVQNRSDPKLELIRSMGVRAYACHPLVAYGTLLGTLSFGTARRDRFSEDEIAMLRTVSDQIAMALERAHLMSRLSARADALAEAMAAAEKNLAQLEAVLVSLGEGVVIADAEGNIVMANPAALALHGFASLEECRAHELRSLFVATYLDSDSVPVRAWPVNALARGESFSGVVAEVRRLDTGKTWIGSYSGVPVRNRNGEIILVAITMRDITAQKQAERELEEAVYAAEAANNAKDRFLAILSHELRTPLAPVLTLAQVLEGEPGFPSEFRPYLEIIRRNVELEVHLIDDLLDLTRITRGKLKLATRRVDLHELLAQVVEICRTDLTAKRLRLDMDLGAARHMVEGDPTRLHQIFWNLVKNAVKFTPEGGRIRIESRDAEDAIEVVVLDNGLGISCERLPHIFNEFEQGDAVHLPRAGGLGLGLAITRGLVELHHGTITAQSDGPGRGARFSVRLTPIE